jgi:xanthine/CO dehydrogenase XdhC/CoxF family maturation factor
MRRLVLLAVTGLLAVAPTAEPAPAVELRRGEPCTLIIFGAGNDVLPLVNMAGILGWKTTVIDGRPAYAKKERFPASCSVILAKPEQVIEQLTINSRTAIVLMTHNYNYDVAALEQLIKINCNYIGVLGPRKKLQKMFEELNGKGTVIDDKIQNIYGPVGLDIGAETSEEIALSIIAEIKAVFSKRQGSALREKTTEIHNRSFNFIQ